MRKSRQNIIKALFFTAIVYALYKIGFFHVVLLLMMALYGIIDNAIPYTPKIDVEVLSFRKFSQTDSIVFVEKNYYFMRKDYFMEISADERLLKENVPISLFCTCRKPFFTYKEAVGNSEFIISSPHIQIVSRGERDGRYIYATTLNLNRLSQEYKSIEKNLYCRIFFVRYFRKIYGTKVFVIPKDNLGTN